MICSLYEELNVIKTGHAFKGYEITYKASKFTIKDFLSDLLNETKDFKYQITLKDVLKKYKPNREIEFRPVYFSSTTKTVLNDSWYKTDNWINERSGWIVELIESRYISISTYRPLSGSSYVKSPVELTSPKKRTNQHQSE